MCIPADCWESKRFISKVVCFRIQALGPHVESTAVRMNRVGCRTYLSFWPLALTHASIFRSTSLELPACSTLNSSIMDAGVGASRDLRMVFADRSERYILGPEVLGEDGLSNSACHLYETYWDWH